MGEQVSTNGAEVSKQGAAGANQLILVGNEVTGGRGTCQCRVVTKRHVSAERQYRREGNVRTGAEWSVF